MLKYEKYTKQQYESLFRCHFFEIVLCKDTIFDTHSILRYFLWSKEEKIEIRMTAWVSEEVHSINRKNHD